MPSLRSWSVAAAVAASSLASPAFAQLWDNGAQGNGVVITHLNGMTGTVAGAHRSAISPGGTVFGSAGSGAIRLADDFTVTGPGWNITSFQFFGYLTGATAPGATALTLRIWDAPPNAGGNVIFGNTTTNVLSNTGWATGPGGSAIYRTTGTDTANATRRLQQLTANVNLALGPGTYWLDFNYTGVSFTPVLSSTTSIPPGNALQFATAGSWVSVLDGADVNIPGSGTPVDLPFIIQGSVVPEPGTYALMLAGGLAVAAFVRRRRAD